ncbi:hypothetical protein B0J11DRAFT_577180 [Dendryphion nanum]|uniref:Uncharacterized protein n=1 Tax=Dendryphion nanum TaxID=256645 RepID=A0A9P9E811_9PLEO|nr:hypothetical protein B0J11DRAFT_577180 [Dendryphion nanum]
MDWTGGQLQRNSKNAVKGTLQKQKQHFARVRTQLQNGTKSGSVPFCPSFLYETEGEIGNCLQSFGSFRHKTHGEGYRAAERTEKEDVQRGKRMQSRHESVTESTQKELPEGSHYLIDVQEAVSATSHGHKHSGRSKAIKRTKRPPPVENNEELLLEARRRKLLSRQDWAGLATSHPVNMQCTSEKNKHRVSKRQKVEGRRKVHRNHTDGDIPAFLGTRAGGKGVVGDISIRIGSDALASQTQMQPADHATSHVAPTLQGDSSDPMLFDHEELCRQSKGSMQYPRSVSRGHQTTRYKFHQHVADAEEWLSCGPRPSDTPSLEYRFPSKTSMPPGNHMFTPNAISCNQTQRVAVEGELHEPTYADTRKCAETPAVDAAQVTGNTGSRLHLIFDDYSDLPGVIPPQSASLSKHAGASITNTGLPHNDSAGNPRCYSKRQRPANCISRLIENTPRQTTCSRPRPAVDDTLWKTFLGICEFGSSSSKASCRGRSGLVDTVFTGLQHATLGDPYISKPSIADDECKGTGRQDETERDCGMDKAPSHGVAASEELWRAFVFADDESSHTESMPTTLAKGVPVYGSSRAVAPLVKAALFSKTWLPGVGVSGSIQDEASCISLSSQQGLGSPMVTSTISPYHIRSGRSNACQVAGGVNVTPTGHFAAYSVTHASLFNNVSEDGQKETMLGLPCNSERSHHSLGRYGSRSPSFGPDPVRRSDHVRLV